MQSFGVFIVVDSCCNYCFSEGWIATPLSEAVLKLIFKSKLDCANCLHICHKKYSVWALALKAIRL